MVGHRNGNFVSETLVPRCPDIPLIQTGSFPQACGDIYPSSTCWALRLGIRKASETGFEYPVVFYVSQATARV